MRIRSYQHGDAVAQAAIYNAAGILLPAFRPVTVDEVERRMRNRDFNPDTRFFAEEGDSIVGYISLNHSGRISFPWTMPGKEAAAELLLRHAESAARELGIKRLFAAYRHDWTKHAEFFTAHGYPKVREMLNFALELSEMPTQAVKPALPISRLNPEDLPALHAMIPGFIRLPIPELDKWFLSNPLFSAEALFVMRSRVENKPVAFGIVIEDDSFTDVSKTDPLAPCFRAGAFGNEGLSIQRVNGLFSFICPNAPESVLRGVDLLGHAVDHLEGGSVDRLAAQVPSDIPHLVNFYQRYFRKQGSFPIYERILT